MLNGMVLGVIAAFVTMLGGFVAGSSIPEIVRSARDTAGIPRGLFAGAPNCGTLVERQLTIAGTGSLTTVIDCSGTGMRVFQIVAANVQIRGLTMRGGSWVGVRFTRH